MDRKPLPLRSLATCLMAITILISLPAPETHARQAEKQRLPVHPLFKTVRVDPPPVNLDAVAALFAQVAVGGACITTFALLNTGMTDFSGRLIPTDSRGSAMEVGLCLSPVDPALTESSDAIPADSMIIQIRGGGIKFIAAEPLSAKAATRTGWARMESSGGALGGAAAFKLTEAGQLKTTAGALAADAVEVATIPVNNDNSQDRFTGYAAANRSDGDIKIEIVVLDESGVVVETMILPLLNPLGPGRQIVRFLHEDSPRLKVKGSIVLIAGSEERICVVAPAQDQGLMTAIPSYRQRRLT